MTGAPRNQPAQERLSRELQPAVQAVRSGRTGNAVRRAISRALRRLPLVVLVVAAVTVVLSLRLNVPFMLPPLVALALVVGYVLVQWLQSLRVDVSAGDAALACDRAHQSRDRLSAALELSSGEALPLRPVHEAMAAAAIEDGLAWLQKTDPRRVAVGTERAAADWRHAVAALLALGLLTYWLPAPGGGSGDHTGVPGTGGNTAATGEPARREVAAAATKTVEPPPAQGKEVRAEPKPAANEKKNSPPPDKPEPAPAVPAAAGAGASGSDTAGDSAQSGTPKAAPTGSPGAGRPGGGQGSAAASSAEPVPEVKKPQANPPKPKKKDAAKPSPEQEAKNAESAGAPSGPSRGSGRMASVANKRSDLERGMEREDDPDIEDEPVEDETNEQEQRGGMMPLKRQDQRPAARELSISGDGPPDQGRGGPTPPKKSRGTASLLLGLRLSDQVRGQPNPGTAKTSIEQIPPRRQSTDAGLAHSAGQGRAGTPQSGRPVQRDGGLLQAYHALLRERDSKPSPSPSTSPDPQHQ